MRRSPRVSQMLLQPPHFIGNSPSYFSMYPFPCTRRLVDPSLPPALPIGMGRERYTPEQVKHRCDTHPAKGPSTRAQVGPPIGRALRVQQKQFCDRRTMVVVC